MTIGAPVRSVTPHCRRSGLEEPSRLSRSMMSNGTCRCSHPVAVGPRQPGSNVHLVRSRLAISARQSASFRWARMAGHLEQANHRPTRAALNLSAVANPDEELPRQGSVSDL